MTVVSPAQSGPRTLATAALLVALLTVLPGAAAAQKDPFIDAFVGFHTALSGTYGDEGPRVVASLDQMAASLAAWDRTAAGTVAKFTSQQANTGGDLALAYLDWGRHDDALTAIDSAIAIEPTRAAFHQLRGLILDASGRRNDAVAAFATAWTLDPNDPIKAYLLADRRGTDADAGDLQPQLAVLLASYDRGRLAGRAPFIPLTLVEDRAAKTPIFSPASYAGGFALVAQGRYQDAIARFREATAGDALVADSAARSEPMSKGIAALMQGRVGAAIELLEAAVAAAPRSSEAHRILGAAYGANRNHEKSVAHLKAAIGLAPRDERARVTLGRELADAGTFGDAERALRDTIAMLPASGEARWALANLYDKNGRGPDAVRELEAAASLTVMAGKGALYWRIAEISHVHQDYERVASALSRRARLMPNEPIAHKDLGLAYNRMGRQDQALVELVMASLLGVEDAETLGVMGQLHLNAGRYTTAEAVLRRAVALQPDAAQPRYALGSTLLRLGKTEEAKAQLAEFQRLRAAALDEQRRTFEIETLIHEADLHTGAGRHDQAVAVWRTIVEREPRRPDRLVGLASALARIEQLDDAVRYLEEAVALGADVEVYRQLAAVYAKLGRADDSARALAVYKQRRDQSQSREQGR